MGFTDRRGQVAFVTGGGGGIGAALCAALVADGATVVVSDRDAAAAQAVAERIGGRACALDVTDGAAFAAAIDRVLATEGRLDYLFNNAGVGLAGAVRDLSLAHWRPVVDVNLWGVINGVQAAYPHLVRQGSGHIVNIASGAGLAPRPGMTPYATVKAAVVALSRSLRAEAAPLGVQVHAVCPGYIGTGIMDRTPMVSLDPAVLTARIERLPVRPISPEVCARRTLKAMDRGRSVIPIGASVWLDWIATRVSVRLADRLAAVRARAFADARRPG